jgi:hypothetical protein
MDPIPPAAINTISAIDKALEQRGVGFVIVICISGDRVAVGQGQLRAVLRISSRLFGGTFSRQEAPDCQHQSDHQQ